MYIHARLLLLLTRPYLVVVFFSFELVVVGWEKSRFESNRRRSVIFFFFFCAIHFVKEKKKKMDPYEHLFKFSMLLERTMAVFFFLHLSNQARKRRRRNNNNIENCGFFFLKLVEMLLRLFCLFVENRYEEKTSDLLYPSILNNNSTHGYFVIVRPANVFFLSFFLYSW